jgi:hypothetical protein
MTSAPKSPKTIEQTGPAKTRLMSSTLKRISGPVSPM